LQSEALNLANEKIEITEQIKETLTSYVEKVDAEIDKLQATDKK
jgi:hypothetical protein